MEWLNYHHLLYFWVVAREGSIVRAAGELGLAHPTISAQIRSLEASLGNPLFQRVGRRLVLTEIGTVVYRYAEEIFATGRELLDTVRGRPTGNSARLRVGVADVLPKALVRRLLDPAIRLEQGQPAHLDGPEGWNADESLGIDDHLQAGDVEATGDLHLQDVPVTESVVRPRHASRRQDQARGGRPGARRGRQGRWRGQVGCCRVDSGRGGARGRERLLRKGCVWREQAYNQSEG